MKSLEGFYTSLHMLKRIMLLLVFMVVGCSTNPIDGKAVDYAIEICYGFENENYSSCVRRAYDYYHNTSPSDPYIFPEIGLDI